MSRKRSLFLEERVGLARKALNERTPDLIGSVADTEVRLWLKQFVLDVMSVLDGGEDSRAMKRLGLKGRR